MKSFEKFKWLIGLSILIILVVCNIKFNFMFTGYVEKEYINKIEVLLDLYLYGIIIFDIIFVTYFYRFYKKFKDYKICNIIGLIISFITILFTYNRISFPILDVDNILSIENYFILFLTILYLISFIKTRLNEIPDEEDDEENYDSQELKEVEEEIKKIKEKRKKKKER